MEPFDEGIRRSIHEARVETLRGTMAAAAYARDRPHPIRERVGRGLISAGERLARPHKTLAPRVL